MTNIFDLYAENGLFREQLPTVWRNWSEGVADGVSLATLPQGEAVRHWWDNSHYNGDSLSLRCESNCVKLLKVLENMGDAAPPGALIPYPTAWILLEMALPVRDIEVDSRKTIVFQVHTLQDQPIILLQHTRDSAMGNVQGWMLEVRGRVQNNIVRRYYQLSRPPEMTRFQMIMNVRFSPVGSDGLLKFWWNGNQEIDISNEAIGLTDQVYFKMGVYRPGRRSGPYAVDSVNNYVFRVRLDDEASKYEDLVRPVVADPDQVRSACWLEIQQVLDTYGCELRPYPVLLSDGRLSAAVEVSLRDNVGSSQR